MDYKLPYYMAYPMPFEYDDERRERRDMEYMRSMYPDLVKRILPFVEDECDRMEYEGSMIYDEYPDMLGIRLMSDRICDRINEMGIFDDDMFMEDMSRENQQMGNMPQENMTMEVQQRGDSDRNRNRGRDRNRNRGRNIVEVLLLHELMRRRNEHRRRRRRFY